MTTPKLIKAIAARIPARKMRSFAKRSRTRDEFYRPLLFVWLTIPVLYP